MLSVGANSCCDVCLEAYGRDDKAPCSITCGHVFCFDCLDKLERPACPLCRLYFDPKLTVKLHLDLDNVRSSPTLNNNSGVVDEQDARRLHQAITKIAVEGCTESQVKQIIAESKSFLQQKHARETFKDLWTMHRMVSYLYEVKSNLRAERLAVDGLKREQAQLQAEKAELLQKIEQQKLAQDQERRNAWAVEMSLRDHCTKAHTAYETMVQQYNYVAKEWTRLNEEIKKLRSCDPDLTDGVHRSPTDPAPLKLDTTRLRGAVVQDEGSILVSPLPQFTGRLNTGVSMFMPLPDLEEDNENDEDDEEEDEEDEDSDEDFEYLKKPRTESQTRPRYSKPMVDPPCNSNGHPYFCECATTFSALEDSPKAGQAQDSVQPAPVMAPQEMVKKQTLGRRATTVHAIPAAREATRRARSHSNPQSTSSGSSSSSDPSRSTSPTRMPAHHRGSPIQHDTNLQPAAPVTRSTDTEGLRSRLQNILTDPTSPLVSTSQPSLPKHTPVASTVLTSARDHRQPYRDERRRSASRSPSPPVSNPRRQSTQTRQSQQHNTTDQFSKLLASHQTASSGISPPSSTSPNPRTSSASDAARAIEQSKRVKEERRRRAVEQERNQPERENERMRVTSSSQVAASHQRDSIDTSILFSGTTTAVASTRAVTVTPSKPLPVSSQAQSVNQQFRYPNTTNGKGFSSSLPSASTTTGLYSS